ncbi:YcaO-like family protein [Azospirillum sp. ST 5-10]|uniref:YcaO-like family protein n=1 Tax=unclassified Azospirillum TaxID=2630922 RepID=UPI003F49E1DC
MLFPASPKHAGTGAHRVVAPAVTLRRIAPVMRRLGVTRLADLTGLDRIGVPVYGAVMPDTDDVLSVYNGKGLTRTDAKVGALMEALERLCALRPELALVHGSYAALARARRVLHPSALVMRLHPDYGDDTALAWAEGMDLLDGAPCLVPAQAVACLYDPAFGQPCYTYGSTNGLGAGNTVAEAVCHALCELVERDAWSLAELLARLLPRAAGAGGGAADDLDRYPEVDPPTLPAELRRLVRAFRRAGLAVVLRDITSDLGVPVFFATVSEDAPTGHAFAHFGLGAHPDALVAARRALTEVAQCRAVDIQGVREDIAQPDEDGGAFAHHARRKERLDRSNWYVARSGRRIAFADVPSHVHTDVADDIRLLLGRLAGAGVERIVMVDLTRPDVGMPVVRVLAAGTESWAADHGVFGWRAARAWRAAGGVLADGRAEAAP